MSQIIFSDEEDQAETLLVIPIIGPRKSSTIANGRSIAEIVEDFSDIATDAPHAQQEVQNDNAPPDSLEAMAAREILKGTRNCQLFPSKTELLYEVL